MAFSQADITGVNPPVPNGVDLIISWTSTAAAGTMYQIYVDRVLTWHGTSLTAIITMPQDLVSIIVGTVGPGEGTTDFSSSLPAFPPSHAELDWIGGTFEGADLAGFHIYGEHTPGGGIDFTDILADVQAYTPDVITDGYGYGGYGLGAWGFSSASYSWESDSLTSGTWHYSVIPYDVAGNEGTGTATSVLIEVPPLPPAFFPGTGIRLIYTFDPTSEEITLFWQASPG